MYNVLPGKEPVDFNVVIGAFIMTISFALIKIKESIDKLSQ